MISNVDSAIIQFLDEHSGKALQKDIMAAMRVTFSEGHVYGRLRTLEARGYLEKARDKSGRVLIFLVKDSEVRV